jgi:ParB family chromosome partitioning protein
MADPPSSAITDASDPDDAADRERAREEKAEKERAERRKLIALNKLGDAAQTVRREWVRDNLLSRKTAPKGAALFPGPGGGHHALSLR